MPQKKEVWIKVRATPTTRREFKRAVKSKDDTISGALSKFIDSYIKRASR